MAAAPPCNIDPPNQCPWYNGTLSFAERSKSLLSALTIDEKLTIMQQGAVDRLHVPSDGFNEAAHGVAWTGRATVFPCSMSMAATWNVPLVREIGRAVAHEALAKHWRQGSNALSFFAPNINIVRDVRWGRAQETYGEDPTLTGALGAAYVDGMQQPNGTGTPLAVRSVAKHFAAYNLESNFAVGGTDGQYRLSYDAHVSTPDLMQTFLPAFAEVVESSRPRGIMCACTQLPSRRSPPCRLPPRRSPPRYQRCARTPQPRRCYPVLRRACRAPATDNSKGTHASAHHNLAVVVVATDNAANGTPLCAHPWIESELRGRMGFEGVVIASFIAC